MNLKPACVHFFQYPTPSIEDNGISIGRCVKCDKVDKAKNYIEFSGWNSSKPKPNTEKKNG